MNSRRRILHVIGENSFVGAQKCNKHAADKDSGTRAILASLDRVKATFAWSQGWEGLGKQALQLKRSGIRRIGPQADQDTADQDIGIEPPDVVLEVFS